MESVKLGKTLAFEMKFWTAPPRDMVKIGVLGGEEGGIGRKSIDKPTCNCLASSFVYNSFIILG